MENSSNSVIELEQLLLHSDLSDDCFIKIFEYLRPIDLLKICEIDTVLKTSHTDLIKNSVIKKKMFDLDVMQQIWPIEKILETFGRSMKRISIEVSFIDGSFLMMV